jgi:replicative DNA helicase
MDIEYNVLSALLYDPKQIPKVELKEEWFFGGRNKEIARVLLDENVNMVEPLALYEEIKRRNHLTLITAEHLDNMSIDGYGVKLEEAIPTLKKRFYQERFDSASRKYANAPNLDNFDLMKDALRELEELERPEDDGKLNETIEGLLTELEEGLDPGIQTYPKVDAILGGGIIGGTLLTIGARPGVGKTAFAINLAMEAMIKQPNLVVDFFTLEMSKMQMTKRFVSRICEINSMKFRNPKLSLREDEKAKVVASGFKLMESELRVHDSMFNINQIERQIRRRHYESDGNPYIAIVDYLGLVEASDTRKPRHEQVGEITRKLKMITNELDIPIILLSQLNRSIESRQDKTPNLSDLRESGSVEQDSSVVMFIHRDSEDENITVLDVAKNREGFVGEIDFNFIKSKMYFEEISN